MNKGKKGREGKGRERGERREGLRVCEGGERERERERGSEWREGNERM